MKLHEEHRIKFFEQAEPEFFSPQATMSPRPSQTGGLATVQIFLFAEGQPAEQILSKRKTWKQSFEEEEFSVEMLRRLVRKYEA
jgi:hypothetical protein